MKKDFSGGGLGLLLKSLLAEQSLSMRKLSAMTGIDTATISRIVNGKQQAKLYQLKQFSIHLHVPLEKLVEAAGFKLSDPSPKEPFQFNNSLQDIQDALVSSKLIDKKLNVERIEQELAKYEQYAQTPEGHKKICEEFEKKVNEVGAIGPYIDELKALYHRYLNEETSAKERATLGSALLYFILSADIIPDYVFPIGYLDDVIAVQLVLRKLEQMS
ncbi:DUF1232 domain-containing protein [Camelliibacillus cellulosilyticus]|uniref:DUF1232 domain-containing protein n=1 Tax=Camelliibacillus cellulosilyticus TaxID=2174486 RepID=A0ABV9GQG7_9BACL